jgi:hypothetical protein
MNIDGYGYPLSMPIFENEISEELVGMLPSGAKASMSP